MSFGMNFNHSRIIHCNFKKLTSWVFKIVMYVLHEKLFFNFDLSNYTEPDQKSNNCNLKFIFSKNILTMYKFNLNLVT